MDLYTHSKPTVRVRLVRLLLGLAKRLVRRGEIGLELKFGTPVNNQMPIDSCVVRVNDFEVFNYRSEEFQAIDKLIEATSKGEFDEIPSLPQASTSAPPRGKDS